jgi:nucleotide-binding universal stress UspA family protein
MHKKILHGLDGSEGSFKALLEAISIAKKYTAELHTLTVEELPKHPETVSEISEENEGINAKYKEMLVKAADLAKREGLELFNHIVLGHEVKAFIDLIDKEKFDLLVVGFMGHSAIYDRVMGSTCQSLVRLAHCSVLVVK